jgi:hypothetical protein
MLGIFAVHRHEIPLKQLPSAARGGVACEVMGHGVDSSQGIGWKFFERKNQETVLLPITCSYRWPILDAFKFICTRVN